MRSEEFIEEVYRKADKDYGLCPPPIKAQDGLNILRDHFLGEDWYCTLSMPTEQVNTEAIHDILRLYPKKRSLREILKIKK